MCGQSRDNACNHQSPGSSPSLKRRWGQGEKSYSPGPLISYTHTPGCSCAKEEEKSKQVWCHHVPHPKYSTGPTGCQTWKGSSLSPPKPMKHSGTGAQPDGTLWYLGRAVTCLMMVSPSKPSWGFSPARSSQFKEPQILRFRERIKSPRRWGLEKMTVFLSLGDLKSQTSKDSYSDAVLASFVQIRRKSNFILKGILNQESEDISTSLGSRT